MFQFRKIRRQIYAGVITFGMAVSLLTPMVPSYAATISGDDEAPVIIDNPAKEKTSVEAVQGEAIVCFRQDSETLIRPEETVMEEQEQEIEGETFVDEAEAILMVDSPEEILSEELNSEELNSEELNSEELNSEELNSEELSSKEEAGDDTEEDAGNAPFMTPDKEDEDKNEDLPGVITVVRSDHLSTEELIAELEQRDDVIYAEPNYIYSAESLDHTGEQWGNDQSYGIGIEQWNTYAEGTPTPKVDCSEQVVAVIDTGVDYTHEDLAGVIWDEGEDYEELTRLGGGKYGYNSCTYDMMKEPYDPTDPMDDCGHGTHCAGIIAAQWNGFGVSGVASGAKIMALKAGNEIGQFSSDAIIRAFNYMIEAKKAGVNVCVSNNSYGGISVGLTEVLLVAEAGKVGIVCCFAAGNDCQDLDAANNNLPLRARMPHVVGVGANDKYGYPTYFSTYGRRDVDVFAPGQEILSTVPMGTGMPEETTSAFMDGDTPCAVNYAEETEFGNDGMGLKTARSTVASVRIGEDGENVLHLQTGDGIHALDTKTFDDLTDLMGGALRVYADGEYFAVVQFNQIDAEGNVGDYIGAANYNTHEGWNDFGLLLDESYLADGEKNDRGIRIFIALARGDFNDKDYLEEVDVRFIRLTDEGGNYGLMSGTSMATPYVAGAVAVLATAFPEDPAEKLAARVTGSVLSIPDMEDMCLSGGIFRLNKALAGETVPVPQAAVMDGGSVRVQGFFFGDSEGTITAEGQPCNVSSWSDTEIIAELPEDLPDGEVRIDVTSDKGTGHNWFYLSKPKDQYDSLPLPGAVVSEDGMYVADEAVKNEYSDFYYADPVAMTALNGSLYVFFAEKDESMTVYRYRIRQQRWERVCHDSEYYPLAVCNWNGKIVLLGGRDTPTKNAVGILDPDTNTVTWKVYREDLSEYGMSMVNTGAGIYIIGGKEVPVPDLDPENRPLLTKLRRLDPETLEISNVSEEDFSFRYTNPVVAAVSEDTFYVGFGDELDSSDDCTLYKITVDPAGAREPECEEISTDGSLCRDMEWDTKINSTGAATAEGIMVTGPVRTDEEGLVIEDTYLIGYDGETWTPLNKVVSTRPVQPLVSTAYDGKYYVLGATNGTELGYAFTAIEVDTLPMEGEKAYKNEWVSGKWYDTDGFRTWPYTGSWHKDQKGWWFSDTNGWYPKNRWQKIDGKYYFFDAQGYMASDEYRKGYKIAKSGVRIESSKYTWVKTKWSWSYVDENKTALMAQWAKIDGKWYYFDKDGLMAENEFVKGYWIDKNGACTDTVKYGWHRTSKGWWYGVVVGWYAKSRTYTIDGVSCTFDKRGYCIEK